MADGKNVNKTRFEEEDCHPAERHDYFGRLLPLVRLRARWFKEVAGVVLLPEFGWGEYFSFFVVADCF